jgi:hypothetical protein
MSSKTTNKKLHEHNIDLEYEVSELIISFNELIKRISTIDVYTGEENIPFSKRDIEFREILLSEFLT